MRHIPFAHVHDHQFGHAATKPKALPNVGRVRARMSWVKDSDILGTVVMYLTAVVVILSVGEILGRLGQR